MVWLVFFTVHAMHTCVVGVLLPLTWQRCTMLRHMLDGACMLRQSPQPGRNSTVQCLLAVVWWTLCLLQIMSTEDVQDQHCAAFDAAMDCVQALLHDELQGEPTGTVRVILQHGQVGAVMGKRGATIK